MFLQLCLAYSLSAWLTTRCCTLKVEKALVKLKPALPVCQAHILASLRRSPEVASYRRKATRRTAASRTRSYTPSARLSSASVALFGSV